MTKRARVIVAITATLVALPVIAYASWIAYLFVAPAIEARLKAAPFESEKWKTSALDGDVMWPTRLRMVDNLVGGNTLPGATRKEVERLLGPPDDTPYFKDWSMVYWLGPERGFIRIDSEWLVLRLDERGVVREFRIVRD